VSKRNNTQQVAAVTSDRSSILTVGLDIGYGVVKVVTDNAAIAFPSVAGHAREIKFQREALAARYPGDFLTDEDGTEWFVGDLALAQLPPGELLRLRGRTANEQTMGNAFRLRLAKAAIGKLAQGVWGRMSSRTALHRTRRRPHAGCRRAQTDPVRAAPRPDRCR
jgi:hypothetical protein